MAASSSSPTSEQPKPPDRHIGREIWRFISGQGAALASVGVDWGTMVLIISTGAHYLVGIAAGSLLGAITEFSLKRWVVFRAGGAALGPQAKRYAVVSLASACINAGTSFAVIEGFHLPKYPWVFVTSTLGGLLWTYPMHRFYVFPDEAKTASPTAPPPAKVS